MTLFLKIQGHYEELSSRLSCRCQSRSTRGTGWRCPDSNLRALLRCRWPCAAPRPGHHSRPRATHRGISSGSASFFCLSPSLHRQGLCPSLWLPQPLETCTSHSCFFFSLLLPLLLPCLQGILPLPFCRPSQPIRALGLFPSKPANHTHSEISSLLLLCCCSQPTLDYLQKRGSCRWGLAELLLGLH